MNVFSALRRWWGSALVVAVLVMVGTVLLIAFAPRTYTASAVVAVIPQEDGFVSGDMVRLAVPTYSALAESESLSVSMAATYEEDRARLHSAISAEVAPSTNIVVVSVRWTDREGAARLANGVVEELVAFSEQDPILAAFVVAPAVPPAEPSLPPAGTVLVLGALAAVVLGTVTALARQRVDPRPRTPAPTQAQDPVAGDTG